MFNHEQWLMPIILATWEEDVGRNTVRGQPKEKVKETFSINKKQGIVIHACHSKAAGRLNRTIMIQAKKGNNVRL
jgi:hypothetical protein